MQAILQKLKRWYARDPLSVILGAGLFFRLLAVIFSKGYGMHDDHFLVIEAGQSFADGKDYNHWLPWNRPGAPPSAHSWFYVGIHFVIFKFLNLIQLADPQGKMYVIRLLHAFYSMMTIVLGFKMANRLGGKLAAERTAWLLAILWFFPGMSVRNLVEMVCIPPLLGAIWYFMRYEEEKRMRLLWYAGALLGLGMGIRFQSIFFAWGAGLYIVLKKDWKGSVVVAAAALITFFFTQAGDLFLWKRPFAEIMAYIDYNLIHKTDYFDRPWYQYFLTVGGLVLPPVSLFLMYAYFKNWRKYLIIFLPSFVFFLFHSYFPNKQERFIMPFIPFMIIAGVCGWEEIRKNISWKKAERVCWTVFWSINILPLVVVSTMYTKRSMVDGMYYLYQQNDYKNSVMEVSHRDSQQWPPQFYSGKWKMSYSVSKEWNLDSLNLYVAKLDEANKPNYILFFQDTDLKQRIQNFQDKTGMQLEYCYTAEPSWMDRLLHWLNPRNKNEPMFIYRVKKSETICIPSSQEPIVQKVLPSALRKSMLNC
jgi:hypothetical protein